MSEEEQSPAPDNDKAIEAAANQDADRQRREAQRDEEARLHMEKRLAFREGETAEERSKRLNVAGPVDDQAPNQ
jgi:hypothetical protein